MLHRKAGGCTDAAAGTGTGKERALQIENTDLHVCTLSVITQWLALSLQYTPGRHPLK